MRWPSFRQVVSPDDFEAAGGMDAEDAAAAAVLALEAGIDAGGWDQVAAFVLEIAQGPNGHVMFPKAYYREAQRVCRERGILIIVDEVQTGLGRCGVLWACELVDLEPDMLVFGKALGGGLPSGGVVVKGDLVSEEIETTGWHWLTFMNQPLQAAAGVAVLDVVRDEGLVERAGKLGDRSRAHLQGCVDRYETLSAVRGPGLFLAVEFNDDGDGSRAAEAGRDAYLHALGQGVLTYTGGSGNILKFKPPLIISDQECDEMLAGFEQVLAYADARIRAAT
jgi:4-aminobutyrate aminotransferase-like enzyme